MFRKGPTRAAILCLGFAALSATPARAGERYYALIFGSQSSPKVLRNCHTWATFGRAGGEGPDPNGYQVEQHTLSWMPASLDARTWSPTPEPGVNLDLFATLAVVGSHDESVTLWGARSRWAGKSMNGRCGSSRSSRAARLNIARSTPSAT